MSQNEEVNKAETAYLIGKVKEGLKSQGSEDIDKDFETWFKKIKDEKGILLNRSVIVEMLWQIRFQVVDTGVVKKGFHLGVETKQKSPGYIGRLAVAEKVGTSLEGDEIRFGVFEYDIKSGDWSADAEFAPVPFQPVEIVVDKVQNIESGREFYRASDKDNWISFPADLNPIDSRKYAMPIDSITEDRRHFTILQAIAVQGVNWYDGQKHDDPLPVIDDKNNVNVRIWCAESLRAGEERPPTLTIRVESVDELLAMLNHELKKSEVEPGTFLDHIMRLPPELAIENLGAIKGMEIAIEGMGSTKKYEKSKPKDEWEDRRFPEIKFMSMKVNYLEAVKAALDRVKAIQKKNIVGLDRDMKPIIDEEKPKKAKGKKAPAPEEPKPAEEEKAPAKDDDSEEPKESGQTALDDPAPAPEKKKKEKEPEPAPEKEAEGDDVKDIFGDGEEEEEGGGEEYTPNEKAILDKIKEKGEFNGDDINALIEPLPSDDHKKARKDLQNAAMGLIKKGLVKNVGKIIVAVEA